MDVQTGTDVDVQTGTDMDAQTDADMDAHTVNVPSPLPLSDFESFLSQIADMDENVEPREYTDIYGNRYLIIVPIWYRLFGNRDEMSQ